MKKKIHLLSLLLLFCSTASLFGQSSRGKDFWLMFNANNISSGTPTLSLFITSDVSTTGNVSIPGMAFSQNFTVTAGTVTTVVLPNGAQITTSDVIENKAIHVTSVDNVVVYGLNRLQFTTDAFLALPTNALGLEHLIMSYNAVASVSDRSQFGVVASQDNTTITITPSANATGHNAGVPYAITLNKNQAYQLKTVATTGINPDLTGTIVIGDKPISVFGSHLCANIPVGVAFCDHLVEQLPSTDTWGKEFITASLALRTGGDIFRVLASKNGTVVKLNGVTVATINRGQFHELNLPSNSFNQISTSEATLVAQFCKGGSADNVVSDPFMTIIPPKEQFFGSTVFTTPATGFVKNFVNIITPAAGVGVITLDGVIIPAAQYTAIGASGFSGARVTISLGSHTLTAPNIAFGAFVYGYDTDDSYGYPAGQVYAAVATATTLTLAPATNTVSIGTNNCLTATLTDQNSLPVVGARIDFNVTGVNGPLSGFGFTNSSGQVQYCYTGTTIGTDNIVANLGALTASATVTWANATVPPPTLVAAGPTPICVGSSVSLSAACSVGVVTWYNQAIGGASIGTGSPLSNIPMAGTITYYATCKNGSLESVRVASNSVIVNPPVTPPIASGVTIAPNTSASLSATCATGTPVWYDANVSGNLLGTGAYVTPNLTVNTTYFVACELGICVSSRTAQTVTINNGTGEIVREPTNENVCVGQNAYFSVGTIGTVISYQWQENRGNGWNNLANSSTYLGVTTANLAIISTTIFMNNYKYRCVLDAGSQIISMVANLGIRFSADGITVIHETPIVGGYVLNQAVLYMIAYNKITSNARVDYLAGNSVVLTPGFEVQAGSVFVAKIQKPCTQQVGSSTTIPEVVKK